MHADGLGGSELTIRDRDGRLGWRLDVETGLPTALLFRQGGEETSFALALTATLETGGEEVFIPLRDFGYVNTESVDAFSRVERAPVHRLNGPKETYAVTTEAGDWTVRWEYTFRQSSPRLELNFDISPSRAASKTTLRDVRLEFDFRPPDLGEWLVEAPGNTMRPGVPATALGEPFPIPTAAGDRLAGRGTAVTRLAPAAGTQIRRQGGADAATRYQGRPQRPCHPRAIRSGHERYAADSHGHFEELDRLDSRL